MAKAIIMVKVIIVMTRRIVGTYRQAHHYGNKP
jgi:hypothetical protein